jgi:hypothetical protein
VLEVWVNFLKAQDRKNPWHLQFRLDFNLCVLLFKKSMTQDSPEASDERDRNGLIDLASAGKPTKSTIRVEQAIDAILNLLLNDFWRAWRTTRNYSFSLALTVRILQSGHETPEGWAIAISIRVVSFSEV